MTVSETHNPYESPTTSEEPPDETIGRQRRAPLLATLLFLLTSIVVSMTTPRHWSHLGLNAAIIFCAGACVFAEVCLPRVTAWVVAAFQLPGLIAGAIIAYECYTQFSLLLSGPMSTAIKEITLACYIGVVLTYFLLNLWRISNRLTNTNRRSMLP